MPKLRTIGCSCIVALVAVLSTALPGCGGSSQPTNPDGTVKLELAPGSTDPSQEKPVPGKK